MGLFGSSKNSYLGVDIGVGGTKVTELRNEKNRARLVTYGFSENPTDQNLDNPTDDPKEAARVLREICRQAKVTTTKAVASLPISSVFSSVITVPRAQTDKDFEQVVQAQARKLIPVPLEEMVLDYKPVPTVGDLTKPAAPDKKAEKKPEKGDKNKKGEEKKKEGEAAEPPDKPTSIQVLITGASNAMVQKYVTIFKAAGLEMVSLESETFPLIRSLVGKDRSATMIVDIGAVRTNIVIVENGIPYVARSLDMGGNNFTKAMSASMGIGLPEAEQMKCDIKSVSDIYPGEGLPKIFSETVMPMVTELQYSINLYSEQGEGQPNKRIERVIVTGGGSALPALVEHLGRELNTKVYVGDPWARIVYPSGLRPVLDEVGYRFGVSVGLAMRDID